MSHENAHIAWRGISFDEACCSNPVLQFLLLGVSARCPSSLLRFAFLRGCLEMLCFPMVLKGFRMHCAELKPQTNQRKCSPEAFHLVPGSPGTQNVTAANGFCRFPNNRQISGLASRVPLARTVPHQGRALEMQGIPMVLKGPN